jgi:Ca-activated chloride channel family protein
MLRPSIWARLSILPFILRMLALSLVLIAFARPQAGARSEEVITEGVDILLAIDVSSSMKTEDFKPRNRLYVAKEVVAEFVRSRPHDRIGMVVFAARALTKCPLTIDHDILLTLLEDVRIGSIEDGTAIGTAIATSVNRLKDSKAKSRIVVLLTDGVNNRGEIDPLTAAELAKTFGIKIYTVGAGREGYAPYPFEDPIYGTVYQEVLVEIDEKTLQDIAQLTDGKYFRATDAKSLVKVYEEIDELEKTEIEQKEYVRYTELAPYFMMVALGLLLAEAVLLRTRLLSIP